MEGDLTLGGEPTTQYADDVLYNSTLETYIITLTNVTPINSMRILKINNIENKKSILSQRIKLPSFLWPSGIPLCKCPIIVLSIHLLMDT